jgi:hypothetical protein
MNDAGHHVLILLVFSFSFFCFTGISFQSRRCFRGVSCTVLHAAKSFASVHVLQYRTAVYCAVSLYMYEWVSEHLGLRVLQ